MSDTPRTDAIDKSLKGAGDSQRIGTWRMNYRQLEREIAAARGPSQQPTREEGELPCGTNQQHLAAVAVETHNAPPSVASSNAAPVVQPDVAAATPRTDAEVFKSKGQHAYCQVDEHIDADFARTLERELSAETARREEAEREVRALEDKMPWLEDFNQLRASLATSEAQRADAEKKRDEMKAAVEAAGRHHNLLLAERDKAIAQRAQAEAKLATAEYHSNEQLKALAEYEEQVVGLESENSRLAVIANDSVDNMMLGNALTTERRAREQAEAQIEAIREHLVHRHAIWCSFDRARNPTGCNCALAPAYNIDSGKPLLARLAKAEADVKRLDWLEDHPEELRNCTWVNANAGRVFTFNHAILIGECKKKLREAINAAMSTEETP